MAVYKDKTLADSSYAPYLAICEKYGIPVVIIREEVSPMHKIWVGQSTE